MKRTKGEKRSKAAAVTPETPAAYIAALPPERAAAIRKLRALLKRRMPPGYREAIAWNAITWSIPLERFPDTYNGQPLCYIALASTKNHMSLYLMAPYGDPAERAKLEEGFRKAGRKLDMGKSCVRFRSLEDLPLDVIGDAVARIPPSRYIARYETIRAGTAARRRGARKAGQP